MKGYLRIGFLLALLAFFGVKPAFSQGFEDFYYQPWVEYQDGEISVAFEQTPVEVAFRAIRQRTGFQIVLPPATRGQLLNLRLSRLPLEPAVRSLISSIGFRSFALMYDEEGRPARAVVLSARADNPGSREANSGVASQSTNTQPASQPLTEEERNKLQKELERWNELKQEERGRIEDRLRTLPPSDEREQLVREYGRQVLGIKK